MGGSGSLTERRGVIFEARGAEFFLLKGGSETGGSLAKSGGGGGGGGCGKLVSGHMYSASGGGG